MTCSGNTGRILRYLQENESISSIEAFKLFGATRLSAIIFNLRKYGYNIINERICSKNRYGEKVYFVRYKLLK